uniref:protein FATTY ACID EXPORT 1, chloroplastic-like isoform X2 n=1 Tax=Erigeron canadensis TaxID=72917 RepID=UPI001CB8D904|nr:protein FATTY ACID EXPORT 1, chloroplastic-like isoform X2 [Erigeron canadensis]
MSAAAMSQLSCFATIHYNTNTVHPPHLLIPSQLPTGINSDRHAIKASNSGGIVFSGGLIGFLFTRDPATLISGGLYGSALLVFSMFSLNVWRQGQSSLPFILGQAGIAAALFWKNMKTYSLTKKILPTGLNVVLSAAMLCFYMYVVVSGGNPPSKKLKSAAAAPS